jgi:hypothetical protein
MKKLNSQTREAGRCEGQEPEEPREVNPTTEMTSFASDKLEYKQLTKVA